MKYAFLHIQSGIVGGGVNVPAAIQQAVALLVQKGGRLVTVFPLIQQGETRGALLIAEMPEADTTKVPRHEPSDAFDAEIRRRESS